jgi:hypothetical protein
VQDPRIERIPCTHSGTYADDCICEKVKQHRCYIVATCDRDLRRRIRKVCQGGISQRANQYTIGAMADKAEPNIPRQLKSVQCEDSPSDERIVWQSTVWCGGNAVRVLAYRILMQHILIVDVSRGVVQIPGVPIMYLQSHRYTIERLPEATMGGAPRV